MTVERAAAAARGSGRSDVKYNHSGRVLTKAFSDVLLVIDVYKKRNKTY